MSEEASMKGPNYFAFGCSQIVKIMTITLQISDAVYASLLSGNARIQGSIGLVSPTEGNFNAHRRVRERPGTKYIKLPHGRVSVGEENVRLTLCIGLMEANIVPSQAIVDESCQAGDFVDLVLDGE